MTWQEFFNKERVLPYYVQLKEKVDLDYKNYVCYPPHNLILNAFKLTPLNEVKVVIMGQDPYHNPNQAMGLAFSVPNGEKLPPSLRNIYKEIENEYGKKMVDNGDLTYLAKQGVLLLNSLLSVKKNQPLSHQNYGYETLIENVIKVLNEDNNPKVFILWGNSAKTIKRLITNSNHYVLTSAHPSPLSAYHGFFGNNHFKLTNEFLKNNNLKQINWINNVI